MPEIVIRELVANALVHQELSVGGTSPLVEIYDDRIEISNPGMPVVDANRFIDGYQSRNEHMAELMRSFGICEEKVAASTASSRWPRSRIYQRLTFGLVTSAPTSSSSGRANSAI